MAKKNFNGGRGSGRGQNPGRGQGRGRGSNSGRDRSRWMYNHEREYIVNMWSYLSMTAREEMLNMLLGMLGGNPLGAVGPDGLLGRLLSNDCQPAVPTDNQSSNSVKPVGKPKKVPSWDRKILCDLHTVSDYKNLTPAERAKDPDPTLQLLSTAAGAISRGKKNFNLNDTEITEGINELYKDDSWDIQALKDLYKPSEESDDGGGKQRSKQNAENSSSSDTDTSGGSSGDESQQDMEVDNQNTGVSPPVPGSSLVVQNGAQPAASLDTSRTTVAGAPIVNAIGALTVHDSSQPVNPSSTTTTLITSQKTEKRKREGSWSHSSDDESESDETVDTSISRNTRSGASSDDKASDVSNANKRKVKKKKNDKGDTSGEDNSDGKPPGKDPPNPPSARGNSGRSGIGRYHT